MRRPASWRLHDDGDGDGDGDGDDEDGGDDGDIEDDRRDTEITGGSCSPAMSDEDSPCEQRQRS